MADESEEEAKFSDESDVSESGVGHWQPEAAPHADDVRVRSRRPSRARARARRRRM